MKRSVTKEEEMSKEKKVFDPDAAEKKRALRIPIPRVKQVFRDKSKYTRKNKYRREYEGEMSLTTHSTVNLQIM